MAVVIAANPTSQGLCRAIFNGIEAASPRDVEHCVRTLESETIVRVPSSE